MYKLKKINNWTVTRTACLGEVQQDSYGFSNYNLFKLCSRLEVQPLSPFTEQPVSKWLAFLRLLQVNYPQTVAVQSKHLLNIFMLDVLGTYRGWRHIKGLPVRGQRTWTNGNSTFRSNVLLRRFKLKISKKIYGRLPPSEASTAYLAEQVNLLWKVQWEQEWKAAKKNRLRLTRTGGSAKADLYAMAKGQVVSPQKLKRMNKKQKQALKKNTFSLGFDVGFTKKIVEELQKQQASEQNRRSARRKSLLTFRDEKKKTKLKKKKVDIRAQKIKHTLKKKSKKSVWD